MSAPTRRAAPVHDFDCMVCGKPIQRPQDGRLVVNTHHAEQAVIAEAHKEHERAVEFERGELPTRISLTELLAEPDERLVPWEPRHHGCYGVVGYEIELERIDEWWKVADWTAHLLGTRSWLRHTDWYAVLRRFAGMAENESHA